VGQHGSSKSPISVDQRTRGLIKALLGSLLRDLVGEPVVVYNLDLGIS